jgi:hypothetical protein
MKLLTYFIQVCENILRIRTSYEDLKKTERKQRAIQRENHTQENEPAKVGLEKMS